MAVATAPSGENNEPSRLKDADQLQRDLRDNPPKVSFGNESPISRREFESDEGVPDKPFPMRFSKDMAAYTSFVRQSNREDSESDMVSTYLNVKDSMEAGQVPPELKEVRALINQNERELDRSTAASVLNDPEIPEEEKVEIAEGLRALREAGTDQKPLSQEFVETSADVDDEASNTGSKIQLDRIRSASEIRANNKRLGQLLSTTIEQADEEDSVLDDIRDFAEIVTPFVEQSDWFQLIQETGLTEYSPVDPILMGNTKRRVADAIFDIDDPQKKEEAFRSLIRAARNKSGVTPMEENEMAMLVELESVLQEGGPLTRERYIDNAISILDIFGLGQIIEGTVASLRGARGARGARFGTHVDEPPPQRPGDVPSEDSAVPPQLRQGDPELPAPRRKPRVRFTGTDERTGKPRFRLMPDIEEAIGTQRGTPFDHATRSNPGVGGRLGAASIMDDTGNFADALGTIREDIAFDINPKPFEYNIDGATPRVTKFLERMNSLEETAFRETESFGGLLSEAERAAIRENPWNHLEQFSGMKAHTGKSMVRFNNEGVEFRTVFGPNDEHGFARFEDAESTRSFKFGSDDDTSSVLYHEVSTGRVREVNESDVETLVREERQRQQATGEFRPERGDEPPTTPPGEFYIRKDIRKPFDALKNNVFREDPTDNKVPFTDREMPSIISRNIQDATSRMASFVRLGAFTAAENSALIERQMVSELAKVWPNSERSKEKITNALMKGDEEQVRYTERVLDARFGMNQDEIEAYYAYRRTADVLWNLQNRDMRNGMIEGGFDRMLSSPEFGNAPVRIAESAEDAVREINRATEDLASNNIDVIDVVTGRPISVDTDTVAQMYERNEGTLARLFQRSYSEDGINRYVWLPTGEIDRTVQIRSLPNYVMPYREGHVPRFYNANWFVDRVPKNPRVDGRRPSQQAIDRGDYRQTLGASTTRRSAEQHRASLIREAESAGRAEEFDFVIRKDRARSRSRAQRTQRDFEVIQARGLTGQRRRGEALKTASDKPEYDYIAAEVEDPWTAMMRTSKAVSRHVTNERVLRHMQRRYLHAFGDLTQGRFPQDWQEIVQIAREQGIEDSVRINKAINFRQQISLFERLPNSTGFDENWSNAWYNIADGLESSTQGLPDGIPKGIRSLGQLQPTQKLKSTAFTMYLAGNPQRQFFVQAGQLMQLGAVDPRYIFSGGMYKDLSAVTMGALARDYGGRVFEETANIGARMMGVSTEEYKRILNALMDRSGIPWNVDQHLLVNAFNDPYSSGKALSREWWRAGPEMAGRGGQRIIQIGKKVGFDAGELANVTGSWLVGRRRWMRNNPDKVDEWDSVANLREINLEGRELSLGMIAPGRFIWQDGAISAVMQFMSVPIKSMLMGTTSNVMSRAEKTKFWANNLALFGPYSIPLLGAVIAAGVEENFQDNPPPKQARRALEGGAVDVMWNTAADIAFNERNENDLLVAQDFSPLAQTSDNYTRMWENTDRPMLEFMTQVIPGISATSRLLESFGQVGTIVNATANGVFGTNEGFLRSMKVLSMIPSGMSNYWKMNLALETGKAASRIGDPTIDISRGEALGKFFGIQNADERDYYEAIGDEIDRRQAIKDDADTIYDFWKQQWIMLGSGTLAEREEEGIKQALQLMWAAYPKEDRDALYREFQRKNQFDRENGRQHVYGIILDRIATKRGYGGVEGVEGIKKDINNMEVLTPQMKQDLNDFIDKSYDLPEEGNVDPRKVD